MRKRWVVVVAVGLLAAAGLVQGPVHAVERGGRTANTFQMARLNVLAGDEYSLVCGFTDFPRTAFAMVTDDFAPTIGNEGFKGAARYSGDGHELRVTGQVSKFRFEQYPPEDNPPYPGVLGSTGIAPSNGVLTKAWASWTSTADCHVYVNGVNQPITTLSPGSARILELAEFNGGGAVQVDPLIAAGALKHQDEVSQGHLSAILDVSSATGSSAALKVLGPQGETYEAVSLNPFVWVEAPNTSGSWSYEITGVQSSPQFPVLWTMELPVF